MIEKLQVLFAVLVCYKHNIQMMHWKVIGEDFECIHRNLDEYTAKFSEIIDDIAEMIMSLDGSPLTLQESIELLSKTDAHVLIIESKDNYNDSEVSKALDIIFDDLYNIYTEIISTCEYSECASKLDEHKYWLRLTGKYKIKRRLAQ